MSLSNAHLIVFSILFELGMLARLTSRWAFFTVTPVHPNSGNNVSRIGPYYRSGRQCGSNLQKAESASTATVAASDISKLNYSQQPLALHVYHQACKFQTRSKLQNRLFSSLPAGDIEDNYHFESYVSECFSANAFLRLELCSILLGIVLC